MSDIAINPVTRRVQFVGNTGTGPYAFTFNILQSSDIIVYKNNVLLTETTDYTVTIDANGTGNVTMVVALVSTDILTMIGGRELSRTTDFVTAGDLLASSLNEQLDSNVIMSQQLDERFGRTIKAQPGDEDATLDLPVVADRADKIMLFDTEGNLTAGSASDFFTNSVLGGNYIINTATGNGSQTAFGLTSSPSVKTNIQVYIDGVYQNKATFSLSGSTLTFSEAPPLNAAIEFMMGEAVTQITGDASAITYNQGGTGAQDRTVKAKLQETVSVKDFGAVGDGVTDDTAAIQAAISSANTAGASLYFPFGTYMANSLDFTVGFTMAPEAKLKFNGSTNGYLADLTANDARINCASFDGALSDCTLLKISGDRNFVGSVYVANSVASASGTSSLYGVAVLGDNNNIESISAYKLENTGYSNESFPQAVFVFGNSNNIQNIYGDYCQSVVVTSTSSDNTVIQNIIARNAHDNGIYWLGGDLLVGRLDYFGNDEPLVCKGNSPSKFKIASLNNYGTGTVGIENATGDIEIEHLYISGTASSIIRLRSGNTASGRVKIHKITGTFTGETLWGLGTGTLDYLSISEMDVTYNYDAAVSGVITSWANYTGCKGFNFGLLKIKIVDVNNVLTASDFFSFLGPDTNLTYRSFVNRINITVVDADGVTQSDGYVRVSRLFADPLVHVENGRVQVNIGPHLREVSDDTLANGIVIIGSSAPTIGTWRRGQVVWYSEPSAGNAPGAVCVSAGTPGTWKEMADLAV